LDEKQTKEKTREFESSEATTDITARQLVLAGIGAVALAYDTANETFARLVGRGQAVTTRVQERADEMKKKNVVSRNRVGEYARTGMDVLLNSLNLPSKGDVDTINVKLNMVVRKMDDLSMRSTMQSQQESAAGPEAQTKSAGETKP
jgi:polyhydroxyalkanoate synthesis regulator phasin